MSSSPLLNKLQEGSNESLRINHIQNLSQPEDFDWKKFESGKVFFQKNLTCCVSAMLCSLVCGLSIINLLEPLVFTGQSDTPRKSLRRYLLTLKHIVLWHYGNIWDKTSDAYKSIMSVHRMHENVSNKMTSNEKLYVSQYDMSLVQSGFIGAIIMYPEKFGISCTEETLDDFVYFWKWIGTFLGIRDENNICDNGYKHAYAICKDIEKFILIPALLNPPEHFHGMAKAFTDGSNILTYLPLHTPESVIGFSFDAMGRKRLPHTFGDKIRILFQKNIVFLLSHIPFFNDLCNSLLERLCNSIKIF